MCYKTNPSWLLALRPSIYACSAAELKAIRAKIDWHAKQIEQYRAEQIAKEYGLNNQQESGE